MTIYQEYTKGVPHMKDAILMGNMFEELDEFNADTYYPIVNGDTCEEYFDTESVKTLPTEEVKVRLRPGEPPKTMRLFVEDHFAYSVEER